MKRNSRLSRHISWILKTGIAVGLILWMIQKGFLDLSVLQSLLRPKYILVCLGLTFVQIFVNNFRWVLLLRGQGVPVTISETFPLTLIGIFFNFALPGAVGGDVVKGYYLLQGHPERRLVAATSILMDRVVGLVAMMFFALLAIVTNFDFILQTSALRKLSWIIFVLFFVSCLVAALLFFFKIDRSGFLGMKFSSLPGGKSMLRVLDAIASYRSRMNDLVMAFVLSFVSQVAVMFFVYLVARNTGVVGVGWDAYFFVVPIGLIVMAVPISPAGVGVGQAAFLFLFNRYLGYNTQLGPTAVTALQACHLSWGLVGAYFYLVRKKPTMTEIRID